MSIDGQAPQPDRTAELLDLKTKADRIQEEIRAHLAGQGSGGSAGSLGLPHAPTPGYFGQGMAAASPFGSNPLAPYQAMAGLAPAPGARAPVGYVSREEFDAAIGSLWGTINMMLQGQEAMCAMVAEGNRQAARTTATIEGACKRNEELMERSFQQQERFMEWMKSQGRQGEEWRDGPGSTEDDD